MALLACGRVNDPCAGPDVVACVGGEAITVADLDFEVRHDRREGGGLAALGTLTEDGRRKILEAVISAASLSQAAREAGLDRSQDVAAEITGTTRRILARHYTASELKTPPIDDEALDAYYRTNPERFRTPEEIRVRQILVSTREEAERLRSDVNAGRDMTEVAQSVNLDASRGRGGSIGWIRRGTMLAALEEAAFGLELGELSSPFQTRFGWHVIRVEERRGNDLQPFDKVKDTVRKALTVERLSAVATAARSRLEVTVTPEAERWVAATSKPARSD